MLKTGNFRWVIVALIFFATTINYLDRQLIGLFKPILELQFGWSESDYSTIVMAFTAAYAVGLLIAGRAIDHLGAKWGYLIAVVIWTLASMGHAMAGTLTAFILVRILLGLGEAGNFPAAVKGIAEWIPPKERGLATGIFNSGTSVGVVVALLVSPFFLERFGWQSVFWLTGALGAIWIICWLLLYEQPDLHPRLSERERAYIGDDAARSKEGNSIMISWKELLKNPHTWAYIAGKFFIDPIFWFFLFWLPSYFASSFNLDLKHPSPALMVIYASTTLGSIFGGYFSSWLVSRGWAVLRARKTVLLIFAVLEVSVISIQWVSEMWVAVALISLVVAVHQAWAANVFTLASDLFPKHTVSSVVGIGGMAGAAGGILFPWFIGRVLDYHKGLGDITTGYHLIFTVCGCLYLLTWLIIHRLTRIRS